ncbi:MAG: D-alanyl-D-alanine carboxypeptidase family protein [Solirubrobacteraceae bacterium]
MSVLQGGRTRRRYGRRPGPARRRTGGSMPGHARHVVALAIGVVVLTAGALLGLMAARATGPATTTFPGATPATAKHPVAPPKPVRGDYGIALAPPGQQIHVKLKLPLKSGLLFDVKTGRVLWERNPTQVVPIASLTKMMTALVVVAHAKPSAKVLITQDALDYTGSGVGLLPKGKHVPLIALLYGLLLPSGNDAAIALADHVAHTQSNFITLMNQRAHEMGLTCTHYTTVSGIVDQGNHSCASDLALIAHTVLEQPLLAQIVGSRSGIVPFPIKGGKLFLYNNNPLLVLRYPGTDGVKTGFTDAAGQCLVATARRGNRWLGVVLMHSGNTYDQAMQLLNAGFAARTA